MRRYLLICIGLVLALMVALPQPSQARQTSVNNVHLAYVYQNQVTLADAEGMPINTPGPSFELGQAATLFWTTDGSRLYIARRDGLFETGAGGAPAIRVPGNYGITLTFDRTGEVLYYLESSNPQNTDDPDLITFPLRELNMIQAQGGTGRLVGYIGEYPLGSAQAAVYGAALLYARDGGLVATGRPRIFPTYGATMFYSCCYPSPGLNAIDLPSGDKRTYDNTIIPGPAAINSSQSRIAAPTVNGSIRVIDLITAGVRDYVADIGVVERIVWGLDDGALYITTRQPATAPLELNPLVTTPIDAQSANITIWRLDLATGRFRQLAVLGDFYGVSSIAATYDYVFVVVVERNERLVNDLNAGRLPQDIGLNDTRLTSDYLPNSILYRVDIANGGAVSIMADVWGVAARPRR